MQLYNLFEAISKERVINKNANLQLQIQHLLGSCELNMFSDDADMQLQLYNVCKWWYKLAVTVIQSIFWDMKKV